MTAVPESARPVTEALRLRGWTVVRITGRSMYPTLHNGERVLISPVVYDELAIGDLIVFHNEEGIICHRLIRKANGRLTLKGDTNLWADPPVLSSQALGRVVGVIAPDQELRKFDTPQHQRRGAMLAHGSYLVALYFHFLHSIGRCRWWKRDADLDE